MRTPFTINDILTGPAASRNQHLVEDKKIKRKKKVSKEKTWMEFKLQEFARESGLILKSEFHFAKPERLFRFDYCFEELMAGFEYEGIMSEKSRHTTIKGYTGDTNKYNLAQQLGYRVFRYTALNYLNLVLDLEKIKEIKIL